MEDRRDHLTSDLVHVRNHQEKSLRCRERGCQSSCGERTMDGSCGTSLGLHLHDVYFLAPEVLLARGGPLLCILAHRRGRSNRVNCGYIAECICNIRSSGVSINGNHFLVCHFSLLNISCGNATSHNRNRKVSANYIDYRKSVWNTTRDEGTLLWNCGDFTCKSKCKCEEVRICIYICK